eukprot:GHVP01056614.1.p1 GENE.GHVP01056614.1~~GHVP01056614.1.p1  ORF type:complete len:617 (-),score=68.22 GHVP01056614.1:149-1999(-)
MNQGAQIQEDVRTPVLNIILGFNSHDIILSDKVLTINPNSRLSLQSVQLVQSIQPIILSINNIKVYTESSSHSQQESSFKSALAVYLSSLYKSIILLERSNYTIQQIFLSISKTCRTSLYVSQLVDLLSNKTEKYKGDLPSLLCETQSRMRSDQEFIEVVDYLLRVTVEPGLEALSAWMSQGKIKNTEEFFIKAIPGNGEKEYLLIEEKVPFYVEEGMKDKILRTGKYRAALDSLFIRDGDTNAFNESIDSNGIDGNNKSIEGNRMDGYNKSIEGNGMDRYKKSINNNSIGNQSIGSSNVDSEPICQNTNRTNKPITTSDDINQSLERIYEDTNNQLYQNIKPTLLPTFHLLKKHFFIEDRSIEMFIDHAIEEEVTNKEKIRDLFEMVIEPIEGIKCVLSSTPLTTQLLRILSAENPSDMRMVSPPIELFTLTYQTTFPINMIISPRSVTKYQLIFRTIFQNLLLKRRINGLQLPKRNKRAYIIRAKINHFLSSILSFLTLSVIEPNWNIFIEKVGIEGDMGKIIELHEGYLDSILSQFMLTRSKLIELIGGIWNLCREFCKLCKAENIDQERIDCVSNRFDKSVRVLVDALNFYSVTDRDYCVLVGYLSNSSWIG